jgi:amino acid permease
VALAFLCCFNVLSVHGSLVKPTRKRMKLILDGSIGICLVLFTIVGLCGYIDAYDETRDNIFLDYDSSDRIILFGRIGYGFTVLFGLPLVMVPCRASFLSSLDQIAAWRNEGAQSLEEDSNLVNGINFDQEIPPPGSQANKSVNNSMDYGTSTPITIETIETIEIVTFDDESSEGDVTFGEYLVHFFSTAVLVVVSYVAAVTVPGVAAVLSIIGSSMAMLISFIIPAACYIKIRWRKPVNPRSIGAWILLVFSSVAAVVCTRQTVSEILAG